MIKLICLWTSVFLGWNSMAYSQDTVWEIQVPVSITEIQTVAEELAKDFEEEDEGISCGGKLGQITLKAANPVDWNGFRPGISDIGNYTRGAFFKFNVEVTEPVGYCADEQWIDCEVAFEVFDLKTGKLDTSNYVITCGDNGDELGDH